MNTMSPAGVLTCGDRNLLMKGDHCCIPSLCFDDLERGRGDTSCPQEGAMRPEFSWQPLVLKERTGLALLVLPLEEHQLQTPLCARPCSGGYPRPWRVGLEFPLVFCSDKALHWGKDASAFLSSGQPLL